MAKNRKTNRQPQKNNNQSAPTAETPLPPLQSTTAKAGKHQIIWIILTLAIAAIPFSYGKYLELGTKDPYDSSFNVYQAKALLSGQKVDRDISISAQPATLMVNVIGVAIFGYSETGPKLMQLFMQLAALGLSYYTLRKFFGNWPAAIMLIMAAFYLSLPPYAKQGNAKEQFMIACTMTAAAAWMLYEIGGPRWWLLLCGAAAMECWYFKQTGISVVIALGLYLIILAVFRQKRWSQIGHDFAWLFYGAGLGLIPICLLYLWQNQVMKVITTLPAAPVIALLILIGLAKLLRYLIHSGRARLNPRWVIPALISSLLIFVLICIFFFFNNQLGFYLQDLPEFQLAKVIGRSIANVWSEFLGYLTGRAGYLGVARDLYTQFNNVTRYCHDLLVPIGFGVTALVLGVARLLFHSGSSVRNSDPGRPSENLGSAQKPFHPISNIPDRIIIFLGIWWILDMAFIWISPRSYVQYYLPLNASAAMLAAWVLFQCRRLEWGYLTLGGCWLLLDWLLVWIVAQPGNGLALNTSEIVGSYWNGFILRLILSGGFIALLIFLNKPQMLSLRKLSLASLTVILMIAWNSTALFGKTLPDGSHSDSPFKERAKSVGQTAFWEQIGEFIKENSDPRDKIYVWGWYPGIYLSAQRTCPALNAAYSDMHSDDPIILTRRMNELLKDFSRNKPRYIVDSQKVHFPFYEHPLFDLWLRWRDSTRKDILMRIAPQQPASGSLPMTYPQAEALKDQILDRVAMVTRMSLTDPKRPGGPMPEDKAEERAQIERQRHEIMWPLREFIMTHYEPVKINTDLMFIYRLKD